MTALIVLLVVGFVVIVFIGLAFGSGGKTTGTTAKRRSSGMPSSSPYDANRYSQPREFEGKFMVCPYCEMDLSGRGSRTRISSFKCPGCSQKVHSDYKQPVYPSPFLTEAQAGYVDCFRRIDNYGGTAFGVPHYNEMKESLRQKFGHEPKAPDVIWGLYNAALTLPGMDKFSRDDIRQWMREFREFEKSLKPKTAKKTKGLGQQTNQPQANKRTSE